MVAKVCYLVYFSDSVILSTGSLGNSPICAGNGRFPAISTLLSFCYPWVNYLAFFTRRVYFS